jgi:protein ImuB
MQPGLWGELGEADARAHRALVRVQGLLGPESVFTAVLGGGRGYAERARLVPWGDEWTPPEPRPWPGRLPPPAPATVLVDTVPVAVRTADGALLDVDERLELTGPPASAAVGREPALTVTGWAGPWPVDERWWAPGEANTLVRLQLGLPDGRALLVARRDGPDGGRAWWLEAIYD